MCRNKVSLAPLPLGEIRVYRYVAQKGVEVPSLAVEAGKHAFYDADRSEIEDALSPIVRADVNLIVACGSEVSDADNAESANLIVFSQ